MDEFITQQCLSTIESYKTKPSYLEEHFGIEQGVLAGGYGYRQILELVQNAADAILEQSGNVGGHAKIAIFISAQHLYAANTGAPLTDHGIETLLGSHNSRKRANQIGRFGLVSNHYYDLAVESTSLAAMNTRQYPSECNFILSAVAKNFAQGLEGSMYLGCDSHGRLIQSPRGRTIQHFVNSAGLRPLFARTWIRLLAALATKSY